MFYSQTVQIISDSWHVFIVSAAKWLLVLQVHCLIIVINVSLQFRVNILNAEFFYFSQKIEDFDIDELILVLNYHCADTGYIIPVKCHLLFLCGVKYKILKFRWS